MHLLKPFTGHTIGASGLLESVLLVRFMQDGKLPPNLPELYAPPGFRLPETELEVSGMVGKLSHGMGGHNALILLGKL